MQAVAEDFCCSVPLFGIFLKDGCSCESEYLQMIEEFHNIFVAITEVTSVTLIEYHHYVLLPYFLQIFIVIILGDGTIQLLNGGNDNF